MKISNFKIQNSNGPRVPITDQPRALDHFWCLVLGVSLLFGVWNLDLHAASLRAGAALVDITPTNLPIRTAGNLTLTIVSKIHDPLHTRAIVLDDGATQMAIAVVDSCMISRDDFDVAKAAASRVTGIPVENMMISSTHTHTAPAAYGCHGNDAEPEYRAYIIPRIAESIVQAWRNLQPARVGRGKSDLPQFVHCRRWIMQPGTANSPNPSFTGAATNIAMMNPGFNNTNKVRQTGPVDPAVTVLSVQTRDGKPLALLANYSTHYASAPSQEISADYFGEFCRLMAQELKAEEKNPGFVALMSNGTSGDANPIDFTKTNWVATPPVVAKAVAGAAMEALAQMRYRDDVRLSAATRQVSFGVRYPQHNKSLKLVSISPPKSGRARRATGKRTTRAKRRSWPTGPRRKRLRCKRWPSVTS